PGLGAAGGDVALVVRHAGGAEPLGAGGEVEEAEGRRLPVLQLGDAEEAGADIERVGVRRDARDAVGELDLHRLRVEARRAALAAGSGDEPRPHRVQLLFLGELLRRRGLDEDAALFARLALLAL